ncbi:MAG: GAF domain-containing protein [Chloroflexi bacterium]|nr:GAF domain-containing protein [Chloroflexota bacterium]
MKAQILVVEDEVVVAESIRNNLENLGYGVPDIADSGETAIEKAGATHPNLVLMDIKLSGDMDGIEAAEQIRVRFDIPVVYLTAFADDETLQRAKITEPYGYILKPLQVRDLHTNIEMALYRHKMERRLRASEEQYRQAEAEAKRRTIQLETLQDVGLKLTAELDLDTLLHDIASSAIDLLGGTWGGLYLYRQDQDVLEWAVTAGDSPLFDNPALHRGEGLAGKVWDTGESSFVDDYRHWTGRASSYDDHLPQAIVAVPVRWGKEFLGVLQVLADPPYIFSKANAELLGLFATQVAIAIRNARLFDEAHRRTERLAVVNRIARAADETSHIDDLIETVAQEVTPLFQADAFCMAFYDKETNELDYRIQMDEGVRMPAMQRSLGTGLTAHVITEKKSLLIRDLDQERDNLPPLHIWGSMDIPASWLGVPLQIEEQVIGVACVQAYRSYAFDEQDQLLLSTITDQLTMAVESTRLFQAEREQRELAEALEEASAAVSTLDLEKVFDRVLEQVERVVSGDAFSIVLVDENIAQTTRWRAQEHVFVENPDSRLILPMAQYPVLVKMAQTGKSLVVPDTMADPDWVRQEGWEWVRSYVGAPIQLSDSTIGFLTVDGIQPDQFSAADARRLEAFTSHVATAIENARLYEQAQRRMESLANLNLASQVLASFLDVKEVLDQIVNLAGSVVDSDYTSVVLLKQEGRLTRQADDFRDVPPISQRIRDQGTTRYVLDSGQPLVVDMISDAREMIPPIRQSDGTLMQANPDIIASGIRSFAAVPIQAKGVTMGVMFVHSREPRAFHGQLALLTTFANQAAAAIENAHLFQAEHEQRELAEALAESAAIINTLDLDQVLDRILEQVDRIVSGDAFNVILLENEIARAVRWRGYEHLGLEKYIAHLSVPLTEYPNMVKMAETGEPSLIPDTSTDTDWRLEREQGRWRSYIGAPIRVEGETVGFLNVNGVRAGQFDADDAQRLQVFADYTAAAIANARLHQKVLDYTGQLEQRVEERTAQLVAQYARLEAILHSTADGIISTDENGKILQINPVARTWLTQSLSSTDVRRLRDAVQDLAQRAAERPKTVLELTRQDLELKTSPISKPDMDETLPLARGEPAAVVVIHDISELKALDRMKTNFIKNASHELRTPITTIKLYVHLMQQASPEDEKWNVYLDSLAREIDDQAQIGEAILQLARVYSGQMELDQCPTRLNELTETIIIRHHSSARQRELTLEHKPTEPGPIAAVDSMQMIRVLNNLVEDAIRYSLEGGGVVVSTERMEVNGHIWATMAVSSTEEEIPERDMSHIFERLLREGDEEPSSQRVRETGLRLMVVKEIVELHQGRVTVRSDKDIGTTFTIWLPSVD